MIEGIVRPARRPLGWRAPGPPPAPVADVALGPHAGEDLCYLAGEWRILQQTSGHRWSLDDLVTAWVAAEASASRPPVRFLDLGCGIGTVLMLLAWRFPTAHGVGIEAQAASVGLARRSLAWNGAAERAEVRHGDFRAPALAADGAVFDLVTGTPPYLTPGQATASRRAQCGPCHFEERGGVEDYCLAAARLVAPAGRFVVCAASFQRERVQRGATAAGLAIARRLDVVPRRGKRPLFDVYTLIPRHAVEERAEDTTSLVVRELDGQWSSAFRALRDAMGMPSRADDLPCRRPGVGDRVSARTS